MAHNSPFPTLANLLLLSLSVTLAAAPNEPVSTAPTGVAELRRFDFGHGPVAPDYIQVDPETYYDLNKGYGLECGTKAASLDRGTRDTLTSDFLITQDSPVQFSVAVPEGNYRVTVTLGDARGSSDTTIKAETRRLMVLHATTGEGEIIRRSFLVNVRRPRLLPLPANAPGLTQVQLNTREEGSLSWDGKLTLEFSGPRACVSAVEIEPVAREAATTVYLVGDSTVTDQPGEPAAGWGQMLPVFFSDKVAVANHAESGETLKSFLMEGRLAKVLETLARGDYLFIQFGHNDSKTQWPQTHADAETTYPAYLRAVIAEARLRGSTPVLVTSMHRRRFDKAGRVIDTHGGYPAAVRKVGAELGVPVIDLHALSAPFYEYLGAEGSAVAFTDGTHHSNYGGYQLARLVSGEIRRLLPDLAAQLVKGAADRPFVADDPRTWSIPASATRQTETPRGN